MGERDLLEKLNCSYKDVIKAYDYNDIFPENIQDCFVSAGSSAIRLNEEYKNKFTNTLEKLSLDRSRDFGVFYHFTKADSAYKILDSSSMWLKNLTSMKENDEKEFEEFFNKISIDPAINGINKIKKGLFTTCFTKTFRSNKFWKEYAEYGSGVCLGFKINVKQEINT